MEAVDSLIIDCCVNCIITYQFCTTGSLVCCQRSGSCTWLDIVCHADQGELTYLLLLLLFFYENLFSTPF